MAEAATERADWLHAASKARTVQLWGEEAALAVMLWFPSASGPTT